MELSCRREPTNREDRFAVAVVKDSNVVGHLPRKISSICSLFLGESGSIICRVTGSRQYSSDLPQSNLEIPCVLTFSCAAKDGDRLEKVRRLIKHALSFTINEVSEPEDSLGKVKIEASESIDQSKEDNTCNINSDNNSAAEDGVVTIVPIVPVGNSSSNVLDLTKTSSVFPCDNKLESQDWLRTGGIRLTQEDKSKILRGEKLNDLVINFVQKLLKKQFPSLKGLQSTLMQYKSPKASNDGSVPQVQVIHCCGDHWIVGSTVHSGSSGNVQIYDSLYDDIDDETVDVVSRLFGLAAIPELITIPKGSVSTWNFLYQRKRHASTTFHALYKV